VIALTFPLLVLERVFAAMPEALLPEARDLRTLLLLPVLAWPAAGLLQIAAGLGWPVALAFDGSLLWFLAAVGAELGLRALGRGFLPPPPPASARAAIRSALARLVDDGIRARGLGEPIRRTFGIDFSRSWALSYIRAAALPVALALVLLSWGLTGVVLVGLDQRAVYERFGAPVAVLRPGLHVILPWPMGQARRLEYGVIHDIALTSTDILFQRTGAEDPAPRSADRLWEQAHPLELDFLIASPGSFQVVSADIRLRYRIGLADRDALSAVYRVAAPETVLRAAAARVVAGFFANRTLEEVLGENREAMAERLRATVQGDTAAAGIDLVAVVIEAIHPPAGAAEAYHNVQAAEINAVTSIAAERGAALAVNAKSNQYATDIVTQAQAAAQEAVAAATADLTRFTADRAAALAGGESFTFERRLGAIAQGAAKSALTVIDHRIPKGDAPLIDLRPFSPGAARAGGTDQE
jgi:regulator of protease activity HflC (stomatin/prohibitin superfamily)